MPRARKYPEELIERGVRLALESGRPVAAVARSPDGLTRTQIRDLCQRNLPAERVEQALAVLAAAGRAQQQRTITGGRPAELWTAARAPVT